MNIDRDQLIAYALDQLPDDQRHAVEQALEQDPVLRAEYRADLEALSLLLEDIDVQDIPVPPDAEDRLMARVAAEKKDTRTAVPLPSNGPEDGPGATPAVPLPSMPTRRPLLWLVPLGVAAALGLFAVLRPPVDDLSRYAQLPGAQQQSIQAGTQTLGALVKLPDQRVYVYLNGKLDGGRTYQLWKIEGKTPVSLGVFRQGVLTDAAPGTTIAVSIEPAGGSPQPTTTPLFVQKI